MPLFRIILCLIFIFGLAGCATATKKTDSHIQSLQSELDQTKTQLRSKDEQIRNLENQLERVKTNFSSEGYSKEYEKLSAKQIQAALKNAGYYDGPIDGKVGKNTKQAIKAFQKENGLASDGIAGKQTVSKLRRYLK